MFACVAFLLLGAFRAVVFGRTWKLCQTATQRNATGGLIAQDSLRVGTESKSTYHDGFDVAWSHFPCCYHMVFDRTHGVDYLRWDDQELVRAKCKVSFPTQFDKKQVR